MAGPPPRVVRRRVEVSGGSRACDRSERRPLGDEVPGSMSECRALPFFGLSCSGKLLRLSSRLVASALSVP